MNRLFGLLFLVILGATLTGCGEKVAETRSFVATGDVTALTGIPGGGLRFATVSGEVYEVSAGGERSDGPAATIGDASGNGVHGLVTDRNGRTFASYTDRATGQLVVVQANPAPSRVVFRSERPASATPSGRMTITAENRIVVAFTPTGETGQLLSIDPDRDADQKANVISTNWQNLGGVAYAAGRVLWAIDQPGNDDTRLARVGPEGPTGKVTRLNGDRRPAALVPYGDTELVTCFAKSGTLQRFSIVDGIQALEGRKLAKDCSGDATALEDGRVAYVAGSEIRITVL